MLRFREEILAKAKVAQNAAVQQRIMLQPRYMLSAWVPIKNEARGAVPASHIPSFAKRCGVLFAMAAWWCQR